MKIIDIDLKEDGKKYFCKQANEVFEVEKGNLIAITRSFSMADLLRFDFEEIKKRENPYERVDNGERYYIINTRAGVGDFKEFTYGIDNNLFNSLNYFNNKNYAEYVAFKENLMRRMDKFAWEHNEQTIRWNDCRHKYFILFSIDDNELIVDWNRVYKSNNIYFTSEEIAKMALEKFKEDLMKLYTWEFDF